MANKVTAVYQDADGWFRFALITAEGRRIQSGEYAHNGSAVEDRNYVAAHPSDQVQFVSDFGPGEPEAQQSGPSPRP